MSRPLLAFLFCILIQLALPGAGHAPEPPAVWRPPPVSIGAASAAYEEPDPLVEAVGLDIAKAIRREAGRSGLDPSLILGIIRTENPWLKPDTINSYGAVGLMQVVGWLHGGEYPQCGDDLTDIDTNLCYGVRIFEDKLVHARGDTAKALLFYNGCAGETYIPGCEDYDDLVRARGDFE